MKGQILVIAPNEGRIPSDVWLTCRRKLMGNITIGGGVSKKAKNTWLAGKVKCGADVYGSRGKLLPVPETR